MDKRFQVFVSSTYADLVEERAEVMQALLELDCMPAGMELFPAANDTQWAWIRKVIDESDYYIVVLGGRYGTVSDNTGTSYTEMEYWYAIERGKPVIAFLHEDPSKIPAGRTEKHSDCVRKLEEFRKFVQTRLCKFWSSPSDLGAKVSRSLTQLIKQHPAVGWVKADLLPAENSSEEILKLKRKIESLEAALDKARNQRPPETESLANGRDIYRIRFVYKRKAEVGSSGPNRWRFVGENVAELPITWDDIFAYFAPSMINGMSVWQFHQRLHQLVHYFGYSELEKKHPKERFEQILAESECFRTILIQLRALKLIASNGTKTDETWTLTPYGDNYMTKLLAVPKQRSASTVQSKKSKKN